MPAVLTDLPGLLAQWEEHRRRYRPATYCLVLCGSGDLDGRVFDHVRSNRRMLSDMAGLYCSATLLAEPDHSAPPDVTEVAGRQHYLHETDAWQAGATGVYDLAHRLDLPLQHLPLFLICFDPWHSAESVILPISAMLTAAGKDEADVGGVVTTAFAVLGTVSRRASRRTDPRGRQHLVREEMAALLPQDKRGFAERLGIREMIAPAVEGVIKGFMN
ncbi:hypothetical protein [Actinoplanes sp. GCM10030250]|uniref:hypothetical protein n=1 Tax=Actinoplanes sp. GCM10030250 TaxID=3273376 RepID=UPI0036177931